jgi:peptidyl-prolyl cis-trans isomerase C
LEEMVKRELLIQEADRRKLDSEPETKAKLEESRRGILLNTLLTEEIFNKVQVSDADVRAYFDKHRDELETSEVHLKQILLKDAKEAEEIRERLLKNESFEEVARKYSADKATGSKGGDLGFLARGQMPPELEKAAFALKPQEVSRIIETPRGYHLLKLVERKKTVSINFDEAKDRLQPYAHAEKQREYLENWLKELEKKAKVKIYHARLPLSLKTPPGMPPQGPSDMPPGKPPTPPHPIPAPPRK